MINTQNGNVYAPAIENRAERQRDRVKQGLENGTVTREELSTVREMRVDARAGLVESKGDNGWVGPAERRALHQDLNAINRTIFALKHNQ
jgi:hypothetical protein